MKRWALEFDWIIQGRPTVSAVLDPLEVGGAGTEGRLA